MSEIRDQLIRYLQKMIKRRLTENKTTSANNLVGIISHFQEFRDWLKNNYNNETKLSLLKLIQGDTHHFHYDYKSGIITNNHLLECDPSPVSESIVMKPKFFSDLETNQSMDTIEDYLSVLELILFIIEELMTQSISISNLMQRIETICKNQFDCYKSMAKIKDKSSKEDIKEKNERILIQFITYELKPIFSFDSSQNSLTIDTNIELSKLTEYLTTTSIVVVKDCLHRQFYRFGRRYSSDLNLWFQKKYEIAVEFMANRGLTLDLIIGLYPEVFEIQVIDRFTRIYDLNQRFIGKTRSLEFELMYKYGLEIRGIVGVITKVTETMATIQSQIEFQVKDQSFTPDFKVIVEFVQIFGQEVTDLRPFVHSGDPISFDIKFFTVFQNNSDICPEVCSDYLWLVSRIYNVRHSANCYVRSLFNDWEGGKWNWPSFDSSDSDHSSYSVYGEQTSDSD